MTTESKSPDAAEVPLTVDLERELLDTLDIAYNEVDIAMSEYEASCAREQKQPAGDDPVGLTYADARNLQATANGLETRVRRLAQRYREDLTEAQQEAARRAQEPFSGKERGMVRTAITAYGETLTKEAKRLQDMNRDNEARALLGDAAVLLERIRPLFAEQHELTVENGPLFASGEPRVTGAMEPEQQDADD